MVPARVANQKGDQGRKSNHRLNFSRDISHEKPLNRLAAGHRLLPSLAPLFPTYLLHHQPLADSLASPKKSTPFATKQIPDSFPKTPEVGYPQLFRAELPLRRHKRHLAPLSPVASIDCAYFLSRRGALPTPFGLPFSTLRTADIQTFLTQLLCYYRLKFASPSTSGKDLCLQTAHVAVGAFPSRSLSLSSEATSKGGCFPSRPRPSCSAATAPASSRRTSC